MLFFSYSLKLNIFTFFIHIFSNKIPSQSFYGVYNINAVIFNTVPFSVLLMLMYYNTTASCLYSIVSYKLFFFH